MGSIEARFTMRISFTFLALAIAAKAIGLNKRQAVTTITIASIAVPDYFQTSPELFPGWSIGSSYYFN